MNYFNPYFYTANPVTPGSGLFSFLRNSRGINIGTILNGTQRTLNIINQAIPVIKQMSPLVKNAKTMFRVMNEFKKVDNKDEQNISKSLTSNSNTKNNYNSSDYQNNNGPTFFLWN